MYRKILVPIDLNEAGFSDKAVVVAADLAEQFQAELVLLNVVPGYSMPMVGSYFPRESFNDFLREANLNLVDTAKENLQGRSIRYHCLVAEGKPVDVIVDQAASQQADLIVMASHKYRRFERQVIGTVANKVIARTDIPVLVVKP